MYLIVLLCQYSSSVLYIFNIYKFKKVIILLLLIYQTVISLLSSLFLFHISEKITRTFRSISLTVFFSVITLINIGISFESLMYNYYSLKTYDLISRIGNNEKYYKIDYKDYIIGSKIK